MRDHAADAVTDGRRAKKTGRRSVVKKAPTTKIAKPIRQNKKIH